MAKNKIESFLRTFVKENISPKQEDISFVSEVYKSFTDVLGQGNCRQIGSLPRYTAIRPLHDLDVLYKISDENFDTQNSESFLKELLEQLERKYVNPTSYEIQTTVQTHSISFLFMNGEDEVFAVDIVPAKVWGKNEFNDDTFLVPEIVQYRSHRKKQEFYYKLQASHQQMKWIKTDPLGYIAVASEINKINDDFRKSVKFIKGWKNTCKEKNENFRLKSFHLEQLITIQLLENEDQTIFDTIFQLLTELKENLKAPCIRDRADHSKFIDQYVAELTDVEIATIYQGIDSILKSFEEFDGDVNSLMNAHYYARGEQEEFLFDRKIPVLIDDSIIFTIDGLIKNSRAGEYILTLSKNLWHIERENSIKFFVAANNSSFYNYLWKIKNDQNCEEVRGDISKDYQDEHHEDTKYFGGHYALGYLISNDVCIAKSRADVIIRKPFRPKSRYHR
ncbi:hypothetical protein EI546_03295 [Aequorivita sp. H23M31]|uniref:Adenylyl/Guanylyl and SMODS C-terminal sensor domain-containing protein n=1 Tax=Aequorivita ciconiae TaxID=2494375 RepID=A0A410G0L0_9FLAO|nr:hypothetical protein [Aequorivita sp. H23M31]QAA80812.1 hypothetical protein EI546_03295 [Aequorivita sp. H23M31]